MQKQNKTIYNHVQKYNIFPFSNSYDWLIE